MSGRAKAAFLFLAILLVDQIVKLYVEAVMLPGESISVISSVFHITYVLNSGAAFGIAFLGFYPRLRRSGSLIHYGSVALAAGAVSNMIDRMRTGHVVDFFDFRVWPVFNVADIAIVLGTAGVLWALFIQKRDLHR